MTYQHPTGQAPKRVTMLALGPSSWDWHRHRMYKGYPVYHAGVGGSREFDELWTCNRGFKSFPVDMCFILDELRGEITNDPDYIRCAVETDVPLVMCSQTCADHMNELRARAGDGQERAQAVAYPLREVCEMLTPVHAYLHNSIPMIIAYARLIGVKEFSLFGADYTNPANGAVGEANRANVEYQIALARQAGMAVLLSGQTTLCNVNQQDHVYGHLSRPPEYLAWKRTGQWPSEPYDELDPGFVTSQTEVNRAQTQAPVPKPRDEHVNAVCGTCAHWTLALPERDGDEAKGHGRCSHPQSGVDRTPLEFRCEWHQSSLEAQLEENAEGEAEDATRDPKVREELANLAYAALHRPDEFTPEQLEQLATRWGSWHDSAVIEQHGGHTFYKLPMGGAVDNREHAIKAWAALLNGEPPTPSSPCAPAPAAPQVPEELPEPAPTPEQLAETSEAVMGELLEAYKASPLKATPSQLWDPDSPQREAIARMAWYVREAPTDVAADWADAFEHYAACLRMESVVEWRPERWATPDGDWVLFPSRAIAAWAELYEARA